MNSLVSTFLVGVLLASIALNVHQWRGGAPCEMADVPAATELEETTTASAVTAVDEVPFSIDLEQLGLTEQQQQVLGSCGEACCCEAMTLREEVRLATVALQDACVAPDVDEAALMQLVEDLCDLRDREVKGHVAALLAVRKVLNPEQMQELQKSACSMERNE